MEKALPNQSPTLTHAKRFFVVLAIAITLALYFWIVSRYPQLNEKATMVKTSSKISDTLVTWPKFRIREDFSFWKKVFYSTLNWCWENRKGMTFGVSLAALLQTMFGYLRVRTQASSFVNSLYGLAIGAPLGVCVNCAAPIYRGLLSTRKTETAFAAMLSSPTLNLVVLTMVFTVFPFYMGLIKVAFTLFVIFVGVPLISKMLGRDAAISEFGRLNKIAASQVVVEDQGPTSPEAWLPAVGRALRDAFRNFFTMIAATVPLMFVTGFLGALLTHLIPVTSFVQGSPGFGVLALAAMMGTLLPVPMAFDIILTNALYALGLAPNLVLVLLCTLGIFSVYSFMIVWSSASKKWAFSLISLVFVMALGVGLVGAPLHERLYFNRNVTNFMALKRQLDAAPQVAVTDPVSAIAAPIRPVAPAIVFRKLLQQGDVVVSAADFQKGVTSGPLFEKLEGQDIGLSRAYRYEISDYPDPFWFGRGTAAGDFDDDGWDDIAFGTNQGLALYKNRGAWFEEVILDNAELRRFRVYAVAFVDLDNDGWLDLFFSTFDHGNHALLNRHGTFDAAHPVDLPNGGGVVTVSPAFADLRGSGNLDIVNGNVALGIVTGFHHVKEGRASTITYNDRLKFREVPLGTDAGETMTSLVSDFDNDGRPDIYLGHDYVFPDQIYLASNEGFREVKASEVGIPKTPIYSMSADSGDVNNDLIPDLMLTGTIERAAWVDKENIDGRTPAEYSREKWDVGSCDSIQDPLLRANCRAVRETVVPFMNSRNVDMRYCETVASASDRESCLMASMWLMITNDFLAYDCDKKFAFDESLLRVCKMLSKRGERLESSDTPDAIAQEDGPVVYIGGKEKAFTDLNQADENNYRHPGGWTWNSKFVDLDNDGWQDTLSAEGVVRAHDYGWNVFMKNEGGKRFEPKQFTYGLTDDFNLLSFSLVDLGNTGRLDIVGNGSVGPAQVYLNRATGTHHSLAVSLRDHRGNRFGVGARVYVRYASGSGAQKGQMREIKASGGYMSFDPLKAYFGLEGIDSVDEIKVLWRDGTQTVLRGKFPAGRHYRIERS